MIAALQGLCRSHLLRRTESDDPRFINFGDKSLQLLSFDSSHPAIPVATLVSLLRQQQLRLVDIALTFATKISIRDPLLHPPRNSVLSRDRRDHRGLGSFVGVHRSSPPACYLSGVGSRTLSLRRQRSGQSKQKDEDRVGGRFHVDSLHGVGRDVAKCPTSST